MYGIEYRFKGRVSDLIAAVDAYAKRTSPRVTPGPYSPIDDFKRRIPSELEYDPAVAYAEYEFTSRFTNRKGMIYAHFLPDLRSLLVVDIPVYGYASDFERASLEWAWRSLEKYLTDHRWIGALTEERLNTPNPSLLLGCMVTRFDEEELKTLCFHLSVDYENLGALGKENKVRQLLLYLDKRQRILELVERIERDRPDINLNEYLTDH
jgi:hypothetical protein